MEGEIIMTERERELTDIIVGLLSAVDCHRNPFMHDIKRDFNPAYQINPKDKLLYLKRDMIWKNASGLFD